MTLLPQWSEPDVALPDRRRLVLVLVGEFDRRCGEPLDYAWRIPAHERRALHVATSEGTTWALADAWMARRPGVALHMVGDDGGVAASVRRVVEYELAAGFDEVCVVVGRLGLRSWFGRLLHDRTADRVARALTGSAGTVVAVLTVAAV